MREEEFFDKYSHQTENLKRRASAISVMNELLQHEIDFHGGHPCEYEWFWISVFKIKFQKYLTIQYDEFQLGHSKEDCTWNIKHEKIDCITAEVEFLVYSLSNALLRCEKISAKLMEEYKFIMVNISLKQVQCSSIQCALDIFRQVSKGRTDVDAIIEKNICNRKHKDSLTSSTLWGVAPGSNIL